MFWSKTKVIFDTNFLLIPGKFGVDVFRKAGEVMDESHELCVFDATLEELQRIMQKSNGDDSFNAKLGYIMSQKKNLKTLDSFTTYADKAILEYAKENPDSTVVATQDKELIKKLDDLSVRTIGLRQEKNLMIR